MLYLINAEPESWCLANDTDRHHCSKHTHLWNAGDHAQIIESKTSPPEENSVASTSVVLHSYRTSRWACVSTTFHSPCCLDRQESRTSPTRSNNKHSHEKKLVGHRRHSGHSVFGGNPSIPNPLGQHSSTSISQASSTDANFRSNSGGNCDTQHSPSLVISCRRASHLSRVVTPDKILYPVRPASRPRTRRSAPRTNATTLSR